METASTIAQPASAPAEKTDRTGRSQLVSNVLFTWGGQLVYFVAGFIMPRMIDRKLGQEVLGIWDFSWSLVTYFRFVDMGITSSVNRYVARHWGKQDLAGINRVVSSATFALFIAALIIFIGTVVAVISLPYWFGAKLDGYVLVTQKSVFCLGVMLCAGTALGGFNGVLTGCHRWELQTMRNSFWQFMTVTAMLIALWLGAGLVTLAAITAIGQILAHLTLVVLAYKACPGLRLRRADVHWSTIKELYIYSGKTLLPTISEMLLNQTTSVLIVGGLGPAALAIFTRPRALLRQMDALERKMGMILIPTTSSLESIDDTEEIRKLLIKSVRYSLYLALPMILVLIAFGGYIMRLWMGPGYAIALIPAILAIGFIGVTIQEPILAVLIGMNAHGRGGVAQVVGSLGSILMAVFMVRHLHAGLIGMAMAITVPPLITNMAYLPWMACRHLNLNLGTFFRQAIGQPFLQVLPFVICLAVGRMIFVPHPVIAIVILLGGCAILAMLYWHNVLPDRLKGWLLRAVSKRVR